MVKKGFTDYYKTLADYSTFVAKARAYEKELKNKEEAIKKAVIYCQKNGILKEFLETNASEVLNMLITEWNMEEAREVWQEEAHEKGLAEGREEGEIRGIAKGKAEERQRLLDLINQGIPIEEIKRRL